MKKTVKEDIYINYESIKDVINKLREYLDKEGATLEIDTWGDGGVYAQIVYLREETGPEKSQRLHKESASKLLSKENRRKEYQKLKEEFEAPKDKPRPFVCGDYLKIDGKDKFIVDNANHNHITVTFNNEAGVKLNAGDTVRVEGHYALCDALVIQSSPNMDDASSNAALLEIRSYEEVIQEAFEGKTPKELHPDITEQMVEGFALLHPSRGVTK